MSGEVDRTCLELWKRSVTQRIGPEPNPNRELEVYLIFTDAHGSLAAVKMAGALAYNLRAHITLLALETVPYALPLDRPPVLVAFTEGCLLDLVWQGAQGSLETAVHLYLCRDRRQAPLQVLKPKSLVVIGGRKRWWPTWESRLVRMLRAKGHQVIFAALR